MKNKITITLSFLFANLLFFGCSKEDTNSLPSLEEIKPGVFKQHVYKQASLLQFNINCSNDGSKKVDCIKTHRKLKRAEKRKSWEGKWMFSVMNYERELKPGTIIKRAKLDKSGNVIPDARKLNPQTIDPYKLVYVGFTSLTQGPDIVEGYDVITNFNNKLMYLSDVKVHENNLSWSLKYEGDASQKTFNQGMQYKTHAKYIPEQDILIGKTDFGMDMAVSIVDLHDDKLKVKEESKKVYIPMGSYIWRATRLDDSAFSVLTKPGEFNWQLPMYLVGIDTKDPAIEKYLYH